MAESIAAFALAGNILQFTEFAAKFANKCIEIHRAGGSAPDELREIHDFVTRQQTTSQRLHISEAERAKLLPEHTEVLHVSDQCSKKFSEILGTLDRIGLKGNKTTWGTVTAAFKATWNEKKIEGLRSDFMLFNQGLQTALLRSLRDFAINSEAQQKIILGKLDSIQEGAENHTSSSSSDNTEGVGETFWDKPGDAVIAFVTRTIDAKSGERLSSAHRLRDAIIRRILSTPESTVPLVGGEPLTAELPNTRQEELQAAFLASFVYNVMDDRHTRITKAHEDTFRWLFQRPSEDTTKWANFKEWLESDASLYWITGKAGSGKSTLMKFICDAESPPQIQEGEDNAPPSTATQGRCYPHLLKWAKDRPLIIASFYFWASGSDMESSPMGLCQSLVFQILQHCPEVIPLVAPPYWEAMSLFNDKFLSRTEEDLRKMLSLVIAEAQKDHNICLFVDGLDEFSGEPEMLINLFRGIISHSNVKLCVSSRPWLVFEDAFRHRPSLKLEDLTYADIKSFVSERFEGDEGFQRLTVREPIYASGLIENIVQKSSGVFLWVSLVVQSLITGLKYDDRIVDIKKRLDLLPADLESLYGVILESLDPFYFQHAAEYFRLMEAFEEPPSALLFSFADEDVTYPINIPLKKLTSDEIQVRIETIRRRINSRCKGLLEVAGSVYSGQSFQYLHKTVKDYIGKPEIRANVDAVTEEFDCQLRICSANLSYIKSINAGYRENVPLNASTGQNAKIFLEAASRIKEQNLPTMIALLDSFDRTLQTNDVNGVTFCSLVYGKLFPSFVRVLGKFSEMKHPFLALAARAGVVEYVRHRASPGCLERWGSPHQHNRVGRTTSFFLKLSRGLITDEHPEWRPLLLDAAPQTCPQLKMIECCLEKGAEVNFRINKKGVTVWVDILSNILIDMLSESWEPTRQQGEASLVLWEPSMRLLIGHGAIVDKTIVRKAAKLIEERNGVTLHEELVARLYQSIQRIKDEEGNH
ncbi:hypothetical protein LZ32DRAFT_570436 [Colletotrichum eremochloae]|nr:hypothetical protein LZ32DRAFT_570436 [Colletotrichum eremochloae]